MARDYDHLFKLLIIGDSGECGRGVVSFHCALYVIVVALAFRAFGPGHRIRLSLIE